MKIRLHELRRIIREELSSFPAALDDSMNQLLQVNKSLEVAHQMAPEGEAKATIAGMHNDMFQKIAEFRGYVRKLKSLASKPAVVPPPVAPQV